MLMGIKRPKKKSHNIVNNQKGTKVLMQYLQSKKLNLCYLAKRFNILYGGVNSCRILSFQKEKGK